jgi:hypothetical protein
MLMTQPSRPVSVSSVSGALFKFSARKLRSIDGWRGWNVHSFHGILLFDVRRLRESARQTLAPSGARLAPRMGVGAVIGGASEAISAYAAGGDAGDIAAAFGRGAVTGGVGALAGAAIGLSTGNPLLVGGGAGLANEVTKQFLPHGGECWDSNALITATLVGGAMGGFIAGSPGWKRGRRYAKRRRSVAERLASARVQRLWSERHTIAEAGGVRWRCG